MATVIFTFNGVNTTIQCLKEDKMENICNKYITKIGININSLFFLSNGNKINKELTFYEQANSLDKERLQMTIIVLSNDCSNE